MALVWSKASAAGAITGCISGTCLGLTAWLVTCQAYYGKINIDNLGGDYPMLAGNLASILGSLAICSVMSLIKVSGWVDGWAGSALCCALCCLAGITRRA
jgi:Na+/proline symporter